MTEQTAQLPEWMGSEDRLDEGQMLPDYKRAEATWRENAQRFFQREIELRQKVKRSIDLTDEDRALVYAHEHTRLAEEFKRSADQFTNQWLERRRQAYQTLHQGRGERFSDHLVEVAQMPPERLPEVMSIASRTGQTDLEAAVAQVALEHSQWGMFEDYARRNPQKAQALEVLRRVPGFAQMTDRVHKALRPPKVDDPLELRPGITELEEAQRREEQSQVNVKLRDFFGPQLRRGRRGRR